MRRGMIAIGLGAAALFAMADVAARAWLGHDLLAATGTARLGAWHVDWPSDDLVRTSCSNGELVVRARGRWHVNEVAPWKWSGTRPSALDRNEARFHRDRCDGDVKAYVCDDDVCRGPVLVPVRG